MFLRRFTPLALLCLVAVVPAALGGLFGRQSAFGEGAGVELLDLLQRSHGASSSAHYQPGAPATGSEAPVAGAPGW